MIVCVCKAVNDRAIRRAVVEGHDTLDALQFELGVGTQCGRCVSSCCEVLFAARVDAMQRQADVACAALASAAPPLLVPSPSTREVALA